MEWGDGEVGRPLRASCGGQWGGGEVGKWGDHFVRVAGVSGEVGKLN